MSIVHFSINEFEETLPLQPEGTGRVVGAGNLALGLAFAREITDKLSLGVQIRYIQETLDQDTRTSIAFDLATFYNTGFRNLKLGVALRNLGPDQAVSKTTLSETFPMPIDFNVSVASEILGSREGPYSLCLAFENGFTIDLGDRYRVGAELWLMDIIALRGGYRFNYSNEDYSFGVGFSPIFQGQRFNIDIAYTQYLGKIIRNFIMNIAGCKSGWNMHSFVKKSIKDIKEKVGDEKVLCGLSGGVDSSVLTVLLKKAVGTKLVAMFIDNGLLRKDERSLVEKRFKKAYRINLRVINAKCDFLSALKGVRDPERKRKIIGRVFIEVFTREARKLGKIKFLAQGTLYPDVIESRSGFDGPSATIKTHHNVGGLPAGLKFELIEPLKELFKDEARLLGKELGLPEELIYRQPFPGPGLAVRIVGAVTEERLKVLREADHILISEIKKAWLYRKLWQTFSVLLPVKSVGVMGDERTYENAVVIRAVTSEDAMTANWAHLPYALLEKVSNRIINEVKGINRVVYDISSKPPSTIEWE